jgi:hypothetical protein
MVATLGAKAPTGDAEVALDEVLAEGRRMGRASARAGEHEIRRIAPETPQKLGQRSFQSLPLSPYRVRALLPFRFHVGADVAH